MPIKCWHKVRNFYKETGKLSKRLFDLRWSFLTTFTKVRIHNMWQECKNVAKIFQREGGSHFVKQMKLTRLSSRPPCRVYSERSSSPKHTISYFEQREQDFNCAPMARKCVTRKCVGSWAPQDAAVKNREENWENSKRTLTYPHTVLPHGSIPTILVSRPLVWISDEMELSHMKYANHSSLTTCGWISDEMEVSRHLTLNSSAINNPSLVHSSRSVQHSKTVQFLKQFSFPSLFFFFGGPGEHLKARLRKNFIGEANSIAGQLLITPSLTHSLRCTQRSKTVQFPKQFSHSPLCFWWTKS